MMYYKNAESQNPIKIVIGNNAGFLDRVQHIFILTKMHY